VVALLLLARLALHYGAELTIKGAFYDALGMGGAYSTRWHTTVLLGAIGVGVALLLSLPVLFLRGRPRPIVIERDAPLGDPRDPRGDTLMQRFPGLGRRADALAKDPAGRLVRLAILVAWLATFVILTAALAPALASSRDELLAWRNRTDFGVTDPIFGNDVGFFVFSEPALVGLARLAAVGLVLATIAVVVVGLGLALVERQRLGRAAAAGVTSRTTTVGFALGGLLLLAISSQLWLSRYALTRGGDGEILGGAGAAVRAVDIPTRTVAAGFVAAMAIALIALAVPPLRARVSRIRVSKAILGIGLGWVAVALAFAIVATPWWLILLVPAIAAAVWARGLEGHELVRGRQAPVLLWPAIAVASTMLVSLLGPVGAALNDAIVLRGSQLQVERENIQATLEATRRATGIDQAPTVEADYRKGGVTRAAIDRAPASVASLRFLDIPPTQEACARLQTINQFYTCDDVDVDRYTIGGERRTLFVIGREIDYSKLPDFQRQHFTYTHGYGLIMAPVDEIEPRTGRPVFVVGGIPQTVRGDFIQPPLARPSIYFGAQPGIPWSMVNTTQPEFDRTTNTTIEWTGTTGVKVGSGWRRLALTAFLGGLPYVGGGRRVWNATSGKPADADSQALLYRDISSRLREIAPFLAVDRDPYFAAAEGRLWVVANAYASTSRYPYAVPFEGKNYFRQTVTAAMDAYTGETRLYVLDENEPVTRTWRAVYPELFTPGSQMPEGLRAHLRYGEDLFDYQSAALGRFHVTDPDVFFNGDDAWAITEEAYGPGVDGQRIISPARYTYSVLPGEREEKFVAVRAYKPLARGRGIGFSGWLAASNEPADFGKLTILRFPSSGDQALDSLDTFTSSVARDPELSQEITTRRDAVLRGNTIVVPIGRGLLYVQPLYLDSPGDSLPTLWQVIVSFGNGEVFAAPTFEQALGEALGGVAEPAPAPGSGGGTPTPPPPSTATLPQLVRRAAQEYEAYRKAFGAGDDAEAARRLRAFQQALAQAQRLAGQ
jgi:uncharacterized membrane protein (UPF0182 family)